MNEYVDAAFRAVVLYFIIIISLRLLGKKDISQLALQDFVLILLISKSLYNDAGLGPGITMVLTLAIINYIMDWILFKSKKARKIIVGEPVVLIENGNVLPKALNCEKLTMDELIAGLRKQGYEKIQDVKWAILETGGEISVIGK
ncbi:MAG: DUF421 domain-containing protein [Bacteroidetes bacterium]|nr:DUF421 domain-containing protein [Bacteroidota bacterium]